MQIFHFSFFTFHFVLYLCSENVSNILKINNDENTMPHFDQSSENHVVTGCKPDGM